MSDEVSRSEQLKAKLTAAKTQAQAQATSPQAQEQPRLNTTIIPEMNLTDASMQLHAAQEADALIGRARQAELPDEGAQRIINPRDLKVEDGSSRGEDGILRDENGQRIFGVYLALGEHQLQLALYDRQGHPIFLPFTNNTLIIRDENLYEQIEENLKVHPTYQAQMMRCSYKEAKMLLELAARTQRETAQVGAMAAPLVRVAEGMRQRNMQFFKQDIASGLEPGTTAMQQQGGF